MRSSDIGSDDIRRVNHFRDIPSTSNVYLTRTPLEYWKKISLWGENPSDGLSLTYSPKGKGGLRLLNISA